MTFLMVCQMVLISFIRYETMDYMIASSSRTSESSKLDAQRTNSVSSKSKSVVPNMAPNENAKHALPKALAKTLPKKLKLTA